MNNVNKNNSHNTKYITIAFCAFVSEQYFKTKRGD